MIGRFSLLAIALSGATNVLAQNGDYAFQDALVATGGDLFGDNVRVLVPEILSNPRFRGLVGVLKTGATSESEIVASSLSNDPLEFATSESILSGNVVLSESRFSLLPRDGQILSAFEVRGTTGQFSKDVVVFDGTSQIIPSLNSASQFFPKLTASVSGENSPVVSYLQAGSVFNEIVARKLAVEEALNLGEGRFISPAGFQISGFDVALASNDTGPQRKRQKGGDDAGYIYVWDSFGSAGDDSDGGSIQARLVGADLAPLGDPFQVNTFTSGAQFEAKVASSNSRFVVVWTSTGSPGDDNSFSSVQARLFAPNGAPLADQFQVNQSTLGEQFEPAVTMAQDGSFIVAWTDIPMFGGNVFAREYQSDGTPKGDEFQLSTEPGANSPDLDTAGGDVIIAWRRGSRIESAISLERISANSFESLPLN